MKAAPSHSAEGPQAGECRAEEELTLSFPFPKGPQSPTPTTLRIL